MDEFILGGEAQETSKKIVLKAIEQADMLQEVRDCWTLYVNAFSLKLMSLDVMYYVII